MKSEENNIISPRSRNGILILIGIIVVLVFIPRLTLYFQHTANAEVTYIQEAEKAQIAKLDKKIQGKKNKYKKFSKREFKRPASKFDPADYSVEDWQILGLTTKQATVAQKFTANGIYSEEQLKKIFVIPDELFVLIKDSVIYKERRQNNPLPQSKIAIKKIDVNSASVEELQELKGIGAFFAKQIVKKRDELGGFYAMDQLLEVWKMDEEKLMAFSDQIVISSKIKYININNASLDEMKMHPYLRYKLANAIIKYRDQHGAYKKVQDLMEIKLFDAETFEKVKPYLTL